MCYQKLFSTVLAALVIAGTANAQNNDIVKWGDGDQGDHFNIVDSEGTIEILRGDGFNYKFYAQDSAQQDNLGVINNITIATGVTGDFTLLIDHETPGLRGALQWKAAVLTYPNGTCTITGIDVTQALLEYDPPPAGGPVFENIFCGPIIGDINIGTLAPNGPGAPLARKIVAGAVTGNINIDEFRGDLDFASLTGNIIVETGPTERTPGDITIRSSYSGEIQINDTGLSAGYVGHVHILGDFSGRFVVIGQLFGRIEIDGDFIVPGRIECLSYIDRSNGGVPPNVHIHGSLANPNNIDSILPMITSGMTSQDGGLRGLIAIDGNFLNAVNDDFHAGEEHEISVWTIRHEYAPGDPDSLERGGIAIDYDGWHSGEDWGAGATIEELLVNQNPVIYTGNWPDRGVFEITQCRGDVDNDGQVTSDDIDSLNLARLLPLIGDGTSDCFVDTWSGLEGSVLWHGDWTCDNLITCVDVNLHRWFLDNYPECCLTDCPAPRACRADFDRDGSVGLQDLADFLGRFGTCDGDPLYNPLHDLAITDCDAIVNLVCPRDAVNNPECIGLEDLALMLSAYGLTCPCGGGGFAGRSDGVGEDPEFVAWVRSASPEEILEWYADWLAGNVGP